MTFAQMYSAISHIFPKENVKDKIKSIKFQDMNIQTHSINKRERWIIQVGCWSYLTAGKRVRSKVDGPNGPHQSGPS